MEKKNPIEEYLLGEGQGEKNFSELFKADDDYVDQMTDLTPQEIRHIATLFENDRFLYAKGIEPVYGHYTNKLMRLLISKERKSRAEYVDVNKAERETPAQNFNLIGGLPK